MCGRVFNLKYKKVITSSTSKQAIRLTQERKYHLHESHVILDRNEMVWHIIGLINKYLFYILYDSSKTEIFLKM